MDAALTVGRGVSSSSPAISVERPGSFPGPVETSAPVAPASVEVVPVIKGAAAGVIPVVVIHCVSVVPVKSPMAPAPSKAAEEADTEPGSEREVRAAVPNPGIGVPARPRHNRPAVHQPRIIRGDINYIRLGRLDDHR